MFAAAAGYERYMGRWSRLLAPHYLAFAGVKDGQRILDIGTGTGSLAQAVEAAFPQAKVVGIDPSEAFVGYAKQHSRGAFEVGNAQALRFDPASFDHSMSMLVLNFIPDHEKALAEMRRVTRPQGVVSACVWDYAEGMQMLRVFWDEVVALDAAMEPKDERHMKLCRQGQLGALWKKAGLADVQEKALVIDTAFASFDDYWGPFQAGVGPGGAYVASLSEERRTALEARLRKRLPGEGARALKARAWCVRGVVPAT
jgi:ubiquinone/menaquinone biosynthesis C-methylase UbiE